LSNLFEGFCEEEKSKYSPKNNAKLDEFHSLGWKKKKSFL
jgi:hypothetical protein